MYISSIIIILYQYTSIYCSPFAPILGSVSQHFPAQVHIHHIISFSPQGHFLTATQSSAKREGRQRLGPSTWHPTSTTDFASINSCLRSISIQNEKKIWRKVKLDSHPAKIVRPEGCGLLTRLEAVVHVPHHSRNHVQEAATIETGECRCETADIVWRSTVHLCLHHYLQAESYVFFLLVAGVLHRKCDGQKRKEHSIE